MKKIKVAVSSLGNIGKNAIDAINVAPDMECIGVLRRAESIGTKLNDLMGVKDYDSIDKLILAAGTPDVVINCGPSRQAVSDAEFYLSKKINVIDSFDIHSGIAPAVEKLQPIAEKFGKVAIVAAGWDPGTDSVMRACFEAMAPVGTTFTNFGRGRSMGHSVAARSIEGVADAVSITIPIGGGQHSRLVYVVLKTGESIDKVTERIKNDNYFAHDPLKVVQLESLAEIETVADASHGVLMERVGASGTTSNQILKFDMRINNPALTAQVMVSCARAATRMSAGAYTMIDIPPVFLLSGDRIRNIKRLV